MIHPCFTLLLPSVAHVCTCRPLSRRLNFTQQFSRDSRLIYTFGKLILVKLVTSHRDLPFAICTVNGNLKLSIICQFGVKTTLSACRCEFERVDKCESEWNKVMYVYGMHREQIVRTGTLAYGTEWCHLPVHHTCIHTQQNMHPTQHGLGEATNNSQDWYRVSWLSCYTEFTVE